MNTMVGNNNSPVCRDINCTIIAVRIHSKFEFISASKRCYGGCPIEVACSYDEKKVESDVMFDHNGSRCDLKNVFDN